MNGILVFDQNQVVEEVEGVVKLAGGAASHSRQKIRGWKIQSLSSPPPFCRPTFFVHLHKSKKPDDLAFCLATAEEQKIHYSHCFILFVGQPSTLKHHDH